MFIPLRTDRAPRRRPIVTELLIIVNVLIFLLAEAGPRFEWFEAGRVHIGGMFLAADLSIWELLRHPIETRAWTLITYQFLHGDFWHILFNMLFLWVFGQAVESRLRSVNFLVFYLLGGIGAAIGHMMLSDAPVIGASGAIAAVTGAYLALFPRSRVIVISLFGMFSLPSLFLIGLYIALDLLRQFGAFFGGGDHIAYAAHLAGYAYGFLLMFILLALNILKREEFDAFFLYKQWRRRAAFRAVQHRAGGGAFDTPAPEVSKAVRKKLAPEREVSPEAVEAMEKRGRIRTLIAAHNLEQAAAQYRSLLREQPDAVLTERDQLDVANQLYAEGHHQQAATAYELLLDKYPFTSKGAEVKLLLGLLYERHLRNRQRAKEMVTAAKDALKDDAQVALANELLAEMAR